MLQIVLLVDMDETLFSTWDMYLGAKFVTLPSPCAMATAIGRLPDYCNIENGIYRWKRNNTDTFLIRLSKKFKLVPFTDGMKQYQSSVLSGHEFWQYFDQNAAIFRETRNVRNENGILFGGIPSKSTAKASAYVRKKLKTRGVHFWNKSIKFYPFAGILLDDAERNIVRNPEITAVKVSAFEVINSSELQEPFSPPTLHCSEIIYPWKQCGVCQQFLDVSVSTMRQKDEEILDYISIVSTRARKLTHMYKRLKAFMKRVEKNVDFFPTSNSDLQDIKYDNAFEAIHACLHQKTLNEAIEMVGKLRGGVQLDKTFQEFLQILSKN